MISYFPQIRPEESTYSIFSRLQFILQPPNFEAMGKLLFNRKFEVGRLNFQGSFDYLCSNLPFNITSEDFLLNNTIYPIFMPFLSIEKQRKALTYFKGDYPDKINKCLRVSNITNKKTFIRVCKECIKEDFNKYGEPYYRRQHEIDMNRMCCKHKVPLYEYTIFPYKIPRRYDDCYTVLGNSKEIVISKEFKENFIAIAEDIDTIFSFDLTNLNIEVSKLKITNKLAEKGYISPTGTTLQQQFGLDFKSYYTEDFLKYIGYDFNVADNDSWIRHTTTRKKPVSDPIKFLLIIRFLFGSFREFYNYNNEYSTFKKGPYPCLNIVCPNYNKLVIKDISQITNSHGHPLATFKCNHCGFTYSRRGPDSADNDIYTKTSVKDYGSLWHNELNKCIDNGYSLRKTAKTLGVTDIQSLKNRISKLKNSNNSTCNEIDSNIENNTLELYKCDVLSFLKENPNCTIQDVYRHKPKAYKYILKHDNEWLFTIIKRPKNPNKTLSKEARLKKYWLNKDELILNQLLEAIDKIKAEKMPYNRITIALLQKHIGYYNLHQNRNKLPKSFKLLDEVFETITDYQKRRADYVIKEMLENSIEISTSKVLRATGISIMKSNKAVVNYIENVLKNHTYSI